MRLFDVDSSFCKACTSPQKEYYLSFCLSITGNKLPLQLRNLEVWFQRPKDVVRKLVSGDLDLGIVGLDTLTEFGQVRTW